MICGEYAHICKQWYCPVEVGPENPCKVVAPASEISWLDVQMVGLAAWTGGYLIGAFGPLLGCRCKPSRALLQVN